MATPLETFDEQLTRLGLLERDQTRPIKARLKTANSSGAQDFARELVRSGLLTRYQAMRAMQGQAQELVLGQYVILDKIGAGGMGEVFKARHRVMGRIVALKVLPRAAMDSPDSVRRFRREVKAAARLSHPNIVTAFDADETGGVHYLVMEFVEGEDLFSLCRREGSLPFEQAVNYILQAAQGLSYAHASGVIHRDIKPHNLLVDREGTVKILDMGLARLEHSPESSDGSSSGLTGTGAIMGTLDYMPPEQASDTRQADQRSDIYSLGCTLYRLVVGETPFRGETVVQKLMAHREGAIPSIVYHRPEVPEQLDDVFRRMVAKQPEDRYPTIHEVIHDLKALSSGRPLKARPAIDPPSEDSKLTSFFAGPSAAGGAPFVAPQMKLSHRRKKRAGTPAGLFAVSALALLVIGGLLYLLYSRERSALPLSTASTEDKGALRAAPAASTATTSPAPPPAPAATRTPPPVQGLSPDGPPGEVLVVRPDVLGDIMPALCFTPDGRKLLLGGRDGAIRLFDLAQGKAIETGAGQNAVANLVFEPDGRSYISAGAGGVLKRWDFASHTATWSWPQNKTAAQGLVCSHDGKLVAALHGSGNLAILKLPGGEPLHPSLNAHVVRGRSVAFSPDDLRLLSGGGGVLPLVLWNVQSGQREANLSGHGADVLSVAISADGRFAASGDDAGTLLIWDFPNTKQLYPLANWHDKVNCLEFTPDNRWLITCGQKDRLIRVLDVQTGKPVHEFPYPAPTLRTLDVSPDGRLVAVSANDQTLRVFRLPAR